MLVPLDHFTWTLLRLLVRNLNEPMTGRQLRHVPLRRTKDGAFLDALVAAGLLAVVVVEPRPEPRPGALPDRSPAQFRTKYRLTAAGERAAEYGEFERPDPVRTPEPAAAGRRGR